MCSKVLLHYNLDPTICPTPAAPLRIPEMSLHRDSSTDSAQQNQTFCRPGALDLSAAFDTIDHAILLDRLRCMNSVDETALNWLRSYLTLRFQYVKIGQDISAYLLFNTDVQQGSVLGPILFTSFISLIPFVAAHFKVYQQQKRMTPNVSSQFQIRLR